MICAIRLIGRVFPFRFASALTGLEDPFDFLQTLLGFAELVVGGTAMPAGVGLALAAVNRHITQLHEPSLAAQLQRLHEELGQRVKMLLAEVGDGVVIRMLIGGKEGEGKIVVGGFLDTPGTRKADRIAVEQQAREHQRVIGHDAAIVLALVDGIDGTEIKGIDDFGVEASQIFLGKPILQRGPEKEGLIETTSSQSLRSLDWMLRLQSLPRQLRFHSREFV